MQQRQAVGERHPDYASSLNQLALLLIIDGDLEQAETLLQESLAIRQEALGEGHPDYATNLSSLGGLLWARGDLDGAEPMLWQAFQIRDQVFGATHPKTLASRQSLEQLLRARGEGSVVDDSVQEVADAVPIAMSAEPLTAPSHDQVEPTQAIAEPRGMIAGSSAHERAALVIRIKTLSGDFLRVGDRLASEVERWKTGGVPPTEALILDLTTCGQEFASLRDETLRLAEIAGISIHERSLDSLREIESLFREISEAESRREQLAAVQERALGVLDRVMSLEHPDLSEFAPLEVCKSQAEELRFEILNANPFELPETATRLAEGDHPFFRLLALVDGTENLSDDLWANSLEVVEHAFGKPLAVAVARAKLILPT